MESRLILALDLTEREKALKLAELVKDQVFAIKVNWPLIMSTGIDILDELTKHSRVICDFKLADVPNTMRLITEKARDHGAYAIISHSFIGADSVAEVVKTAGEMRVISVVAMSNAGSYEFVDPVMDNLIDISLKAGVHGFIAPGNKYDILSRIREKVGKALIFAPGVGAQGGDAATAIKSGADYVIVGRHIYNSPDPIKSASEMNEAIRNLL